LVELPEPEVAHEQLSKPDAAEVPPELHRQLRAALASGPLSLGQLRRSYNFDPVMLLRETVGAFPTTYVEVDCDGHLGLGLREDAPPLDVQLDRGKIVELIKASGQSGIYLSSLYRLTGMSSNHIAQVLEGVEGIVRTTKDKGRPLYRATEALKSAPAPAPEDSRGILEEARDRLVSIIGPCRRDLRWLENFLERATILGALKQFPGDFCIRQIDERPDHLQISLATTEPPETTPAAP
jgi:hypothetical protein